MLLTPEHGGTRAVSASLAGVTPRRAGSGARLDPAARCCCWWLSPCCWAIHLLPSPAPLEREGNVIALTQQGKACLAIIAFAVTLWVTETVPFAHLADDRAADSDVRPRRRSTTVVAAGFGAPIIAFFIGVLILTSGFTRSGLGTRLVYLLLAAARHARRPRAARAAHRRLVHLVVDHRHGGRGDAAAARRRAARATPACAQATATSGGRIMIATAFGPLIGGIATPAGTAANLVAIAQLRQLAGIEISFTQWMALRGSRCRS